MSPSLRARFSWRCLPAIELLACLLVCSAHPCAAVSFTVGPDPTLSQEIDSLDVAVIVRRVTAVGEGKKEDTDWYHIDYVVETIVKGETHIRVGQPINTLTYRDAQAGDLFLLMGVRRSKLEWGTPLAISARGREYVLGLGSLPKQGPERLRFIHAYLGDAEEVLERDTYQEFQEADYATLQQLKPILQTQQLVKWLEDREVTASRKRVYYELLSICGSADELPLLEKILRSQDRVERDALEAAIDCYLTLKGAAGLPLVEELYLGNFAAHSMDTYCAIMAVRLHASERKVISRERLNASLRLVLKRYDLADLVIPDLMRWEDWTVVEEVFAAFKGANEEQRWVRVPAIEYLRRCPLAQAKTHLRACERIDPQSVRSANERVTRDRRP